MLAAAHMNINSSNFSFKERKTDFNTPKMNSLVKTPEERAKEKKRYECLSHKKTLRFTFFLSGKLRVSYMPPCKNEH